MMVPELTPTPDDVTQAWWDAARERRFVIQRCNDCHHMQHYPRAMCVACGCFELEWHEVSGIGTVDSFTTVYRAPHPDLETPYVIARIRLDEGPTVLSRIIGSDETQIGCDAPVRLEWQEIPEGFQLPVFRIDTQ